jgi:predicted nucleic-acid-binding protein
MIGLDTNVLLRWLISVRLWPDDAPEQTRAAARLLEDSRQRFFINHVVLAEVVWVLDQGLKQPRADIVDVVGRLLRASNVAIDRSAIVEEALSAFAAEPGDFADHLIGALNAAAGCQTTYTFDRKASRNMRFSRLTT